MTSFVHLEYSNQHPGVERVELAIASAQKIKRHFSGTRGLATLLLSAIAAAVMVAAYQVMDSVADGHLLVLWTGLWAVAFAAMAVCASTVHALAARLKASLDNWSANIAKSRADQRLWAAAKSDPRVMAELQLAMNRQDETLTFVPPAAGVGKRITRHPAAVVATHRTTVPPYKPQYI